ncbi:MAG: hypothetical protein ACO1PZ_08065 [Gammaproteobacteria bacterium]
MQITTDTPCETLQSRRRLLALPFVAALALGSAAAGMWAVGEIRLVDLRRTLDGWAQAGEVGSLAEWDAARGELALSMKLLPDSGEHYGLAGLLHEWRFFVADSPVDTEADILRFRQAAIDAYRSSAQLRPAWPLGWAELARQKAMLAQDDAEFALALQRALALGPHEESVDLLVTDIATFAWPAIAADAELHDVVLERLTRSLSRTDEEALLPHLIYLVERNMQSELCPLLPVDTLAPLAQEACALPYPEPAAE